MSGTDCATPSATCDPAPVSNCATKFYVGSSPSLDCQCATCDPGYTIASSPPPVSGTGDMIGTCTTATPSPPLPNCLQSKQVPAVTSPPTAAEITECVKCNQNSVLNSGACHTVPNCKTGYTYWTTSAECMVADTNSLANIDGSSVVAVPAAQQANGQCRGYQNLGITFGAANARCDSCNSNYELDSTSNTKYECVSCTTSTPSATHCAEVAASEGNCICRECAAPTGGQNYVKHPLEPGCVQIADISSCTAYGLRLANGAYAGVCTSCTAPAVLATDGKSCVSCSKTCSNGQTSANSANNDCLCTCNNNFLINTAGDNCVACGSSQIPNCATFVLESDTCKCTACNANYKLKTDKSGCVDCTSGGGGATANCKDCSLVTPAETAVDKCTTCQAGYALNPGTAPTNPTCLQCLPNPGCAKCTVDTAASPATTINKCTECSSGYVLNSAGTCIQCPTSPAACSDCRIDPDNENNALC